MKLPLDLHDIYNHGAEIEKALQQKFDEAIAKKAPLLEMQFGVARRATRSGIAAPRYACLSPIDAELSMSNRMSTLSIPVGVRPT